jgi:peptidoglycan hydrolase-like protein with peptidoglycan-binding domain
LTSLFGYEWNPGIDQNTRLTLLFHDLKEGAGGYFRSADEYQKLQVPDSNEREMLYLAVSRGDDPWLKIYLAHEFVHLITFNQKDRLGVQEDVWLNEARADYAPTIMGYDDFYEGSNLQKRVKDFLSSSGDSLTEWQETKYDYAVASVFTHYLVDRYGIRVLADSLKSKLVGIASINEVLAKNGFSENFSQIFTNWTIAIILNSCSVDAKYCFTNPNLATLKINPTLIFLPLSGSSSLSTTNTTKNWSGNWQKIIGGSGDLTLEFSSLANLNFQVPYVLYDKNNNVSPNVLKLDKTQKGSITIKNFGQKYNALIIAPSLQTKTTGFGGAESAYPYTFTVSITGQTQSDDSMTIQKLLDQIEALKKQIALLQVHQPSNQNPPVIACRQLNSNLYVGVSNTNDVRCLQQVLISVAGGIYPEALVTGVFGNLTRVAVMRFQAQYAIPQTGFVGILTRQKINQLLASW